MLLHIVAFANTMCDLVLTGPRASTPDVLDTPDDDVPEPYPQSPPETDARKAEVPSCRDDNECSAMSGRPC